MSLKVSIYGSASGLRIMQKSVHCLNAFHAHRSSPAVRSGALASNANKNYYHLNVWELERPMMRNGADALLVAIVFGAALACLCVEVFFPS